MNWRKLLFLTLLLASKTPVSGQLPNGSVAPDFTAQDIMGKTHHLYDVLDSGKIVILEISATWCPPCWVYHTSHALQDLYAAHGPAGDNKVRVFWVEGDPSTNLNCLYGSAGCNGGSAGNYVAGTPYPILNNASIANAFQISYYPSIFIICPNKKTIEVDPLNAENLWEKAQQCPVAAGTNNAGIFQYNSGTDLTEICGEEALTPSFLLTNLGSAPLTAANIELKWNSTVVQNLQWTGYLPTYGEANVSFSPQSINDEGLLKTTITNINNGTGDDDFSNNVRNDNFTLSQEFNTTQILLKIRTDNYGAETYWEVRDELGNVIEHGGNELVGPDGGGAFPLGVPIGAGTYPNLSIIRDTLALPAAGCYSIHFSDAYGDGICCDFGSGYYKLYNLDNPALPILTGGEFEEYSRRAIRAGTILANTEPNQNVSIEVFPNPASDFLNIGIEALADYDISGNIFNSLGQLQHHFPIEKSTASETVWQVPVSSWPNGVYFLQVNLNGKTATRTFLVAQN